MDSFLKKTKNLFSKIEHRGKDMLKKDNQVHSNNDVSISQVIKHPQDRDIVHSLHSIFLEQVDKGNLLAITRQKDGILKNTLLSLFQADREGRQEIKNRLLTQSQQDLPQAKNKNMFCISMIGFHHKQGTIIEYLYPQNEVAQQLPGDQLEQFTNKISQYSMPDASHLQEEDYVFFNMEVDHQQFYGVSCYFQQKVTAELRQKDKELTRNTILKAVVVVSRVPLFGSMVSKLRPAAKAFMMQGDFKDTRSLQDIYYRLDEHQKQSHLNLDLGELHLNTCLRTMLSQFKDKLWVVYKAVLLRKNIIVYSQKSSHVSNFIVSLMSLFQGYSQRHTPSQPLSKLHSHLLQYGLPFNITDQYYKLILLFGIHDIDEFDHLQGYIIGTTNTFIRTHNKTKCHVYIDLDHTKIEIETDPLIAKALKPTEAEKAILKPLQKKNKYKEGEADYKQQEESVVWEGSDDSIRLVFSHYFKSMLLDLVDTMTKVFLLHLKITSYNKELKNACLSPQTTSPPKGTHTESDVSSDFEDMIDKIQNHNYLNYIRKQKKQLKAQLKRLKKYNKVFIQVLISMDHYQENFTRIDYQKLQAYVSGEQVLFRFENGDIFWGAFKDEDKNDDNGILMTSTQVTRGMYTPLPMEGPFQQHALHSTCYFIGSLEKGQKAHSGEMLHKNIFYRGLFQSDTYYGNGTLDSPEQNYEGQFVNGRYDGYGILKQKQEGSIYMGEFSNGMKEGKGQYTYNNQDVFNGRFVRNKRQGPGVVWNQQGEIYEGIWVDDQLIGTLKYTDAQQNVYTGYVHKNEYQLDRPVSIKFTNGLSYEGLFQSMPEDMQSKTSSVFQLGIMALH